MSELRVGSKVRVRNDLVEDEYYDDTLFIEDMIDLMGRVVTIVKVSHNGFEIREDDGECYWSLSMFEPIIKAGDKVCTYDGVINWVTDINVIYTHPYTLSNDMNDIGKSFSQMMAERPDDALWRVASLEEIKLCEDVYVPLANSSIILEPLGDSNNEIQSPS